MKRTFFYKSYDKNHPRKDYEGNLLTCPYCKKFHNREYGCFRKAGRKLAVKTNPSNKAPEHDSQKLASLNDGAKLGMRNHTIGTGLVMNRH